MSFSVNITYNSSTEFSYDAAKVVVATEAKLLDLGGGTYDTSNPVVLTNFQMGASDITSFSDTVVEPGSDTVGHILELDGAGYYHDGLTWVTSDGTYFNSNSSAEITAALATLVSDLGLGGNFSVKVRTFLHSDAGTSTPEISAMALGYDFSEPDFTGINECQITANLADLFGDRYTPDPANPPKLYVSNDRTFSHTNNLVFPFIKSIAFDSLGQATISIIETETVGEELKFFITLPEGNSLKTIYMEPAFVPNSTSKSLTEITTVIDLELA